MDFVPGSDANCAGSPNRWQPLRDAAFSLHGIHPLPATELNGTKISVMDSLIEERGIENTKAVLNALRAR